MVALLSTMSTHFFKHSSLETKRPLSTVVQGQKDMGPVFQSIVSLTSSLRGQLVKCFTTE